MEDLLITRPSGDGGQIMVSSSWKAVRRQGNPSDMFIGQPKTHKQLHTLLTGKPTDNMTS